MSRDSRGLNVGVSALAKRLGVHSGTITRKLQAGMSIDQIQADAERRQEMIAAGLSVRGRRAGSLKKNGELTKAAVAFEEFVYKAGGMARGGPGPGGGSGGTGDGSLDPKTRTGLDDDARERLRRKAAALAGRIPVVDNKSNQLHSSPIAGMGTAGERESRASSPSSSQLPSQAQSRQQASNGNSNSYADIEDLADAQRRKESALADLRELELAQKRGELIPAVTANAHICGMLVRAREILMRIAPEWCDRLAIISDAQEIFKLIDSEIRRALAELREIETV